MGEGDKKNMLRYQNKYRSMLRNNPDYVKGVMEEMRAAGESYIDPFAEKRRRAGRKNRDMGEMAMELIASLSKLGKDGEAIVSSLYEIFCRASGNMAESDTETPRELSRLRSENARLERELEQLHQSKKQLAEELAKQAALGSELERRLSTLESLNRGFVTLAGMGEDLRPFGLCDGHYPVYWAAGQRRPLNRLPQRDWQKPVSFFMQESIPFTQKRRGYFTNRGICDRILSLNIVNLYDVNCRLCGTFMQGDLWYLVFFYF